MTAEETAEVLGRSKIPGLEPLVPPPHRNWEHSPRSRGRLLAQPLPLAEEEVVTQDWKVAGELTVKQSAQQMFWYGILPCSEAWRVLTGCILKRDWDPTIGLQVSPVRGEAEGKDTKQNQPV